MSNAGKKLCMVSLGCPKNLVDSEVMLGILKHAGVELTANEADADILVVNTCGFIGDAKEESIDAILSLAEHKKTGRCRKLIVAGCLSQRYKDDLSESLPVGLPTYIHDYTTPRIISTPGFYAYVKVAEGCSNHCSYCSIPSIRGEFRSRPIESVVKEADSLAAQGIREITLIAQDRPSCGRDRGEGLEPLLKRLIAIVGIEWIRLL